VLSVRPDMLPALGVAGSRRLSQLPRHACCWLAVGEQPGVAAVVRSMMGMSQVLRGDLPPVIPDDVDDPVVVKAQGVVTLPRRVNWSRTDPTYDLSDRRQRARVYEQVLREGAAEDVRYFIDIDELIDLWDELVLPPAVSRAWIDWLARHRNVRLHDCRERIGAPRRDSR
jgi:hypothetical protein